MMEEISWQELNEIYAYTQLEPWGEEREDLRMAISTSATVNALIALRDTVVAANSTKRSRPRRSKLTTWEDFMPRFSGDGKARAAEVEKPTDAAGWASFKKSIYGGLKANQRRKAERV